MSKPEADTTPGQRFQSALRKQYGEGWRGVYDDETRTRLGDEAFRLNIGSILRAMQTANVHLEDGAPPDET